MNDLCLNLKELLENEFSMPFHVLRTCIDGENRYVCQLYSLDNMYFDISVYIHNNIRLNVEIVPQKHGGYILNEMAAAPLEKKLIFLDYLSYVRELNAKVNLLINNNEIQLTPKVWPNEWKTLFCRLSLLPIPEIKDEEEKLLLYFTWLKHGINLMFSLLTISENDTIQQYGKQSEGTATEVKSIRYERNKINRELCLAEKGYRCSVCGFDFEKVYGTIGHHFIEVHHLCPVSTMNSDYIFNVHRDLVPLCPNCHSMIHKRNPPFTISELKEIMSHQKK